MQGDKKIGLALGILLIGIVAAFFFRNEPSPQGDVPQLEDPESLDARIEEQRLTPYPATEQGKPPVKSDWNVPDFLANEGEQGRPAPPPQPIPFGTPDNSNISTFQPDPELKAPIVGGYRMYTVQPGDTLSGISSKFLGRSSRYHEIYEANKDQMRSADDLRLGTTLRIPIDGHAQPSQDMTKTTPPVPPTSPKNNSTAPNPRNTTPAPRSNEVPNWNGGDPFAPDPIRPIPRPEPVPERHTPQTYAPPIASNQQILPASRPQVTQPAPKVPASPQVTHGRTYQIQPGDNLEQLALKFYGDRRAVRKIYEANKEKIPSPHRLPDGMTITLP